MSRVGSLERDPPRFEIKALGHDQYFHQLRFFLTGYSASLQTSYPPRIVQSIYLDTHNGRSVAEISCGQAHRQKFRFRWYGNAHAHACGALELKIRDNALTLKSRIPISEPISLIGQSRRTFLASLRRHCPPDWQSLLDEGLEPAQWIQYERHYVATRCGEVRVTIDRHLRAWDLRDNFVLSRLCETPLPPRVVLECKAPPERFDEIQGIMNALPMPRTRCSKYAMATHPAQYHI